MTAPDTKNDMKGIDVLHQSTKDYDIFKKLPGNRKHDEGHVKQLVKSMTLDGNLTSSFPIVVNEYMEVIDGQHRLEALKILNWPVYYRIEKGLNIATVRSINQAGKNWSWRNFAESYAELGKQDYRTFMELADEFDINFSPLLKYCGAGAANSSVRKTFNEGEFKIVNIDRARKLLTQYQNIVEALEVNKTESHQLAVAILNIMNTPLYSQSRMMSRIEVRGPGFKLQTNVIDTMRELEILYNYKLNEENRVRLY